MSLFDIANSKKELQQLEQKTTENDFWQKDSKETSKLRAKAGLDDDTVDDSLLTLAGLKK